MCYDFWVTEICWLFFSLLFVLIVGNKLILQDFIFYTMKKQWLLLFCVILFNISFDAKAQESYISYKKKSIKEKTLPFSDRWSIRTNAVDWITTVPNIAVEFDVSDSVYNRWALGAGFKFNYVPQKTDFSARFTYKIAEARLEARKYFRAYQMFPYRSKSQKQGNKGWWRAYYVGPYVSYTYYAMQFADPTYKGKSVSAGITGGYNVPLYETRNGGAIDLDIGLSIGVLYVDHLKMKDGVSENIARILPYPMLTDLRLGFVYRWRSVRKKYVELNEEKILQRHTERMMKEKLRLDRKYQDSLRQDSVNRVKQNIRIKKQKK